MADDKKQKLFLSLRSKMKMAGFGSSSDSEEGDQDPTKHKDAHASSIKRKRLRGNDRAVKTTRKIKFGWIHCGKTVRLKTGGGVRDEEVNNNAVKEDLIALGKSRFFPAGKSKRGNVEDFEFDILNYEHKVLNDTINVKDLAKSSGVSLLRFYLQTNLPSSEIANVKPQNSETLPSSDAEIVTPQTSETLPSSDAEIVTPQTSETKTSGLDVSIDSNPCNLLSDTIPCSLSSDDEFALPDLIPSISTQQSRDITASLDEYILPNFEADSTSNSTATDDNSATGSAMCIKVCRSNIVNDLVGAFKAPEIMDVEITFQFINERGSDEKGVSREVYTAFWKEFLDTKADGERLMVPSINSDNWQSEEWSAIAKIYAKGFLDLHIVPLKLAPAFVVAFCFGPDAVTSELLMSSIMRYLSQNDEEIVKGALSGNLMEDDEETFIDIMSGLGCQKIPKTDDIRQCLLHRAHIKFIQEPKFILDCFTSAQKYIAFRSVEDIMKLYEECKPTGRKIISLLKATPNSEHESKSLQYFEQYIRAQREDYLCRLLRFMTGSDTICVEKIEIEFTNVTGYSRRPIAHCCGPVLELPTSYTSYRELRQEFDSVLSYDMNFVMDLA